MSNALTCSTSSSSCAGGSAPAWLNTSLPFLKAIRVGMDRMSAAAASPCSASVSTLACTMSGCLSDEAAKVGANARHGPHHDAQKSTSTISLSVMASLNCSAVMSRIPTPLPTSRAAEMFPSVKVPERVRQPVAERGIEFLVADLAHGAHGGAELLEVILAAVAFGQVLIEAGTGIGVECLVEVCGDEFDEFVLSGHDVRRCRYAADCGPG